MTGRAEAGSTDSPAPTGGHFLSGSDAVIRLGKIARFVIAPSAMLLLLWHAIPAQAGLTFYTLGSDFSANVTTTQLETFEASNVAPNSYAVISGPLDSTSNNAAFAPGSIQTGISFASFGGDPNTSLVAIGHGTAPGGTSAIGTYSFSNGIEITLANSNAIGLNLFASAGPGSVANAVFQIGVFGASGLLGSDTVTTTGVDTFFGVDAGTTAITKIDITQLSGVSTFVDNVAFGAGTPTPPVTNPTSDQAAFLAANPGLSIETFEESRVPDHTFFLIPSPLNTNSINAAFLPGDLLPGVNFASIGPDSNNQLVALGTDVIPGATKGIGVSAQDNSFEMTFDQLQNAVGFNILLSTQPGVCLLYTSDAADD